MNSLYTHEPKCQILSERCKLFDNTLFLFGAFSDSYNDLFPSDHTPETFTELQKLLNLLKQSLVSGNLVLFYFLT